MSILKVRDKDGRVYEILALKGEKGDKGDPGEPGGTNTPVDLSTVANALKGNASGGIVVLNDISPCPHTVKVKISGVDELNTSSVTVYSGDLEPITYKADANGNFAIPSIYPSMKLIAEGKTKNLLTGNVLSKPSDWFDSSDGITFPDFDEVYFSSNNNYQPLILKGSYLEAGKEYIFGVEVLNYTLNNTTQEPYRAYAVCLQYISGNNTKYESAKIQLNTLGKLELTFKPTKSGIYNLICFGRDKDSGSVRFINPKVTLSRAEIECEYNRDINKAFAKLQQAIISLGGKI